jgi:hypothetical protein
MNIQATANEYINIAQEEFGPMCSEWRYVGVEINDMPPHLRYYHETASVSISLSKKVTSDETQLHFQLAHEVCHLLYPAMSINGTKEATTVLNEGVSTYFSVWAAGRFCSQEYLINNLEQHSPNYFRAMTAVQELLKNDQEAIKKLRLLEPELNKLTHQHFEQAKALASKELISELLSSFE